MLNFSSSIKKARVILQVRGTRDIPLTDARMAFGSAVGAGDSSLASAEFLHSVIAEVLNSCQS